MKKIPVLINPEAGRGSAGRRFPELEAASLKHSMSIDPRFTKYPGHARKLAAQAVEEGEKLLVVMGGDGTISEVADALADSGVTIGVIPAGTGNDIARSLGILPRDTEAAFSRIVKGDTISFDVGLEKLTGRRFLSFIGCGFPAMVAEEANKMKYMKGSPVFFLSLYKAVIKLRGIPLVLTLDGQRKEMICTSIMIQNTPFTGGGLKVAPGARINDGYFDVVVVDEIGRVELMRNFPKLYSGRHLEHPAFHLMRGKQIKVELPENQLVSYDGETTSAERLEIEIKPGAIRLIV
ncbi:MAG: diacylglycerol kinase family protein [Acidobacteriota bacterium]